jgi:hypothetical protein
MKNSSCRHRKLDVVIRVRGALLKSGKVDYWSGKIRIFAITLGYWEGTLIYMDS